MSSTSLLDPNSPFGDRVLEHLAKDRIIWLTTTARDGTPQPRPVWFVWTGEVFLIYSQPGTAKLAHIKDQPRVALHFDGDGHGGDIVVFTGEAVIQPNHPLAHEVEAYARKYSSGFKRIHMTPERFGEAYSVALVVTPIRVRGH